MAKVCDIDSGRENVEPLVLVGPTNDKPVSSEGPPSNRLDHGVDADVCEPCRTAIQQMGFLDGILYRYALSLSVRDRGPALKRLLPSDSPALKP